MSDLTRFDPLGKPANGFGGSGKWIGGSAKTPGGPDKGKGGSGEVIGGCGGGVGGSAGAVGGAAEGAGGSAKGKGRPDHRKGGSAKRVAGGILTWWRGAPAGSRFPGAEAARRPENNGFGRSLTPPGLTELRSGSPLARTRQFARLSPSGRLCILHSAFFIR